LIAFDRIVKDPRGAERHDLLIAGEGPQSHNLRQQCAELHIEDRVKFVGRKNHAEAVELFLGCSFFVLSSRADEGLPVVSLEALAAGAPIIATRSGGTPEAVQDGINGLIIAKDDVNALEDAMRRMAADAPLRKSMRAANVVRAKEYDWSSISRKYAAIYEQVAAANKKPIL